MRLWVLAVAGLPGSQQGPASLERLRRKVPPTAGRTSTATTSRGKLSTRILLSSKTSGIYTRRSNGILRDRGVRKSPANRRMVVYNMYLSRVLLRPRLPRLPPNTLQSCHPLALLKMAHVVYAMGGILPVKTLLELKGIEATWLWLARRRITRRGFRCLLCSFWSPHSRGCWQTCQLEKSQ